MSYRSRVDLEARSFMTEFVHDSNTNELIPDKKLDDQAAEIARQQYRNEMGLLSPKRNKAISC